ncbi:MAG TPA: hypothetical protein PL093_01955 [Candidatus Pacearchaeota archaeon]|nr:hypothetical protein [Candidatus Pacearchaeota archaeon]HRR95085.1 hypothetical protein [Candidatus Paceibacterota bacterium]HPC30730.1 hypothetical protein [Candidatus Pacearchaeota archaeon]HQG09254.1 hypothetical protein [Candidatus Pacearchaeota archaeon]HQH20321.1 hypothetical protein [Candidatus Pacearchaeota archaeon]
MVEDWLNITTQALQSSWESILIFLPKLLGALVVFLIGWFVAIWLGKIIAAILEKLKFNELFNKTGWKESFEKAEITITPSDFIGAIIKWIFVVIALMVASDILEWVAFSTLLNQIIMWVPNLIIAIAILVVAIILADILEKIVKASTQKIGVNFANQIGTFIRIAIYTFAILIALMQLGVAPAIINTLVVGFVITIALAFGLAFGLGGKEMAEKFLEDWRHKLTK